MRLSSLAAPVACSMLLHVVLLHAGWQVMSSSTGSATPWRAAAPLRVSLARDTASQAQPANSRASIAPYIPQGAPETAPARRKPRAIEPLPPALMPPRPEVEAAASAPAAAPAPMPALPNDQGFADAGGVDEPARLLREPDFYLPNGQTALNWQINFDLLIDAQGKVVRVDNVSEGAPRDVIGAVLMAFFNSPFEPARLAGEPVAVRQRFEVGPESPPDGSRPAVVTGQGAVPGRQHVPAIEPLPGAGPVRIPLPPPAGPSRGGEGAVTP
jgi:hypothetical protein